MKQGNETVVNQPRDAWQLVMFNRSLKKQLKLKALQTFVPPLSDQRCLLISCGDNNGALNWHFRRMGGVWEWGDVGGDNLSEMSNFLGESVVHVPETAAPFADDSFDIIVAIDVLEHLRDDQPFLAEIWRILRPDGLAVVTVPNGDPALLANRIKFSVGMTPEVYGHTRAGYTVNELSEALALAQLVPVRQGGYSRFFTEMMELIINFGYVFVLSRKDANRGDGEIAPTSSGQMKTHGTAFRLYSFVFPFMKLISSFDALLSAQSNNAVIVSARKCHG